MKQFVIFGDMEFLDDNIVLVHRVNSALFIDDADIEATLRFLDNCDYIVPHHCSCKIVFVQHHEETA
jgi:hypothetical protein